LAKSNKHSDHTFPRIAAALDLGSNTLRLIVARVEPVCAPGAEGRPKSSGSGGWRYHALAREIATPRLGRGLTRGGELSSQTMQAAFEQAAGFVGMARDMGAASIVLAASQACRKAANGPGFVKRLGKKLGLDRAVILTGEQEARLSGLGVLSRLGGDADSSLASRCGWRLQRSGSTFQGRRSVPY
jgi:exopolyphosphatase/guanosine-5'-triphosphate,3'-diphosphate pyrophosphatase